MRIMHPDKLKKLSKAVGHPLLEVTKEPGSPFLCWTTKGDCYTVPSLRATKAERLRPRDRSVSDGKDTSSHQPVLV